jgi:hypothetical protein
MRSQRPKRYVLVSARMSGPPLAVGIDAPFPWFGGKRRVASIVWDALGDCPGYIEPFAGSLAVLLNRPTEPGVETVNDKDGYVANFWRAVKADPEAVADHADWPVNETDLFARHLWLVNSGRERLAALEADPDYFDSKVAGWWVWGLCAWIGSGWCSGTGPWQLPHLGDPGRGVNRKLPHLGDPGRGYQKATEQLRAWAEHKRIPWTDDAEMLARPEVHDKLERELRKQLRDFAQFEMPKKLLLLPEDFSIEAGELTPTLKVKRRVVEQRYHDRIEALYAEREGGVHDIARA